MVPEFAPLHIRLFFPPLWRPRASKIGLELRASAVADMATVDVFLFACHSRAQFIARLAAKVADWIRGAWNGQRRPRAERHNLRAFRGRFGNMQSLLGLPVLLGLLALWLDRQNPLWILAALIDTSADASANKSIALT